MFLLMVPAYPGCPGSKAVKRSSSLLLYVTDVFSDLSVSLSLFADDLKLYTRYKTDILHNDLYTAINRLTK